MASIADLLFLNPMFQHHLALRLGTEKANASARKILVLEQDNVTAVSALNKSENKLAVAKAEVTHVHDKITSLNKTHDLAIIHATEAAEKAASKAEEHAALTSNNHSASQLQASQDAASLATEAKAEADKKLAELAEELHIVTTKAHQVQVEFAATLKEMEINGENEAAAAVENDKLKDKVQEVLRELENQKVRFAEKTFEATEAATVKAADATAALNAATAANEAAVTNAETKAATVAAASAEAVAKAAQKQKTQMEAIVLAQEVALAAAVAEAAKAAEATARDQAATSAEATALASAATKAAADVAAEALVAAKANAEQEMKKLIGQNILDQEAAVAAALAEAAKAAEATAQDHAMAQDHASAEATVGSFAMSPLSEVSTMMNGLSLRCCHARSITFSDRPGTDMNHWRRASVSPSSRTPLGLTSWRRTVTSMYWENATSLEFIIECAGAPRC